VASQSAEELREQVAAELVELQRYCGEDIKETPRAWPTKVLLAVLGFMRERWYDLWFQFWLHSDEFHPSLKLDSRAMIRMTPAQRRKYRDKIAHRREAAHRRDLHS